MNMNEVIANRCNQLLGDIEKKVVHPNDHVNKSQSSNDSFPTAMNMTVAHQIEHALIPTLTKLQNEFKNKEKQFSGVIKTGRTHF